MTGKSTYTPERGAAICDLLSDGWSMKRICKRDDMPDGTTVRVWLRTYADFRIMHELARQEQADTLIDEIIDIADGLDMPEPDVLNMQVNASSEFLDFGRKQHHEYVRDTSVERDRLRIEARLKVASKLRPKKYGATQHVEISGDPNKPILSVTRIEIVAPQLLNAPEAPMAIEHEPAYVNAED